MTDISISIKIGTSAEEVATSAEGEDILILETTDFCLLQEDDDYILLE